MSCMRIATMPEKKMHEGEWDPDFTKVTSDEATRIAAAENSGFIDDENIDWDNFAQYAGQNLPRFSFAYLKKKGTGCIIGVAE